MRACVRMRNEEQPELTGDDLLGVGSPNLILRFRRSFAEPGYQQKLKGGRLGSTLVLFLVSSVACWRPDCTFVGSI